MILVTQCLSFSMTKAQNRVEREILGQSGEILLEENSGITDEELKNQIRGIVEEIHARDGSFLDGVDNILVSKEDLDFLSNATVCDDHLLGAFSDGKIMIKESGFKTNRRTLYHEAGHNVWKNLGEDDRSEWNSLFFSSENFITPYASTSAEEDFAESFACTMTDEGGCPSLAHDKKIFLDRILTN